MARQRNHVLRELMTRRGLTLEGLAEDLCAMAVMLGRDPVKVSPRHIGRWVSGEVLWPWDRHRELLEAVLGQPAEELGFVPPPGYERSTVPPNPSSDGTPVLRRHFITGLGAAVALPSLPTAGRLGHTDIDTIQAATTSLDALDDRHGGAAVAAVAAAYARHVEQAARTCTYGGAVQNRLHRALGELAANVGWFAYDADCQDDARQWWDLGIRYATLADDVMLQARIWSSMARQACDFGHGGEAVALARVALDRTRTRRDARLSALLHTRVALGHSLTGESSRTGQSLHRAEQALDRAADPATPWLSFCGPAELVGLAALCDYNLGRFEDAADRDVDALGLLPQGFVRNKFAMQVSLARNHLAAGRAEEALEAGDRALDLLPDVKSPRWAKHLDVFARSVQRRGPAAAGADFAERYRAVAG
jgi:tetratricopeptide (TPR) repeat protein/transcriptional regulator with XRE-family HTH domain